MMKCEECDNILTTYEIRENNNKTCFECDINNHISRLAFHVKEERIIFEELIRKLLSEMDK